MCALYRPGVSITAKYYGRYADWEFPLLEWRFTHLLGGVGPEPHGVRAVGLELGAVAASLDPVQHLQTAQEHPAV